MSGHSKWSTIKRRKGAQDAKRGKLFTKVIKEITIAARSGGGDPDGNPRLRRAIDLARGVNMPAEKIFDKNGGQIGTSGSAAWAFEQKGMIRIDQAAATEDELFEAAVGGGAENMELVGDQWIVTTPRNELDAVRDAIVTAGIAVDEAALEYIPNNPNIVEGDAAAGLIRLYEALEEHDDIQNVYSDFELSEQALAEMA